MPQSFFLVRLKGIKGPLTFSKVLGLYSAGQLHDATPVWDSGCRRWYQFGELKLRLVAALRPERAPEQVQVAWIVNKAGFEQRVHGSTGRRRGGGRLFRRFAWQKISWRSGVLRRV